MAGEHSVQVNALIEAFASEWNLKPEERATLYRSVAELERQAAVRKKA